MHQNNSKFKFTRLAMMIVVAVFCLTAAINARAVITFDAASEGYTDTIKTDTLIISHTVGAGGANRILVVGVNIHSTRVPMVTVSTMTYAGQNMTFFEAVNGPDGSKIRTELLYIKSPATGSNNITFIF
jgi:hypothetical protein